MTKRITLRISPSGEIKADVMGFEGRSCVEYISVLEKMLDAEAVDSRLVPEYCADQELTTVVSQQDEIQRVGSKLNLKE